MRAHIRVLASVALAFVPALAGPVAPEVEDPCQGKARCAASGPFLAEIVELTPAPLPSGGKAHTVRLNLRFRNISSEPIVLAYVATTSTLFDVNGNQYVYVRSGRWDASATGIGLVQGHRIDPQFVLKPGEARNAAFQVTRPAPPADTIGTPSTYDITIAQLEARQNVAPSSKAQFALHFAGLDAPVAKVAGTSSLERQVKDVQDAAKAVGDLFKKKK